jgi:MarR family transcriptional regulator, organic hydroperoxide resistance regulator
MDDHRVDSEKDRHGSPNNSEVRVNTRHDAPPALTPPAAPRLPPLSPDDCWPVLVEFTLSQRYWWIGICESLDLTPMQGHALRVLDPDRPVAMSVLADTLICDASNVTGIVDKLESRGLIVRQSAENDRRIKMLAVTPKGRELRERLCARLLEPPRPIAAMPAEARRELAEVLRAVLIERAALPDSPT